MVRVKRVYDVPAADDGKRILVERLWPRGMSKDSIGMDFWLKDVAPSTELRRWFNHDPKRWTEFKRRYSRELDANAGAWAPILAKARRGRVTLLYSAHDVEHNNAVVLMDYVNARV